MRYPVAPRVQLVSGIITCPCFSSTAFGICVFTRFTKDSRLDRELRPPSSDGNRACGGRPSLALRVEMVAGPADYGLTTGR